MGYRVSTIHNELHKMIIIAMAHRKSVKVATIIKMKFDESLTEAEIQDYIKHYNNMTEEERKHPDK